MLNSNPPLSGPPHFVDLHVNPGESVSIQLFDGNETILRGPATITMISQHTFPPIPMPVQVPPGHMIQQIVDENGTLRHIILSALNNNATNASNASLMPQQQQPFPYCCCCCYSCTGTAPTAPLPPPPPPPPPPQVHHNILAFPTQQTRRRLPSRTYSPAGKRAPPAFYNNNTLGKSPIRGKSTTTTAPVDGVSKVSYPNIKHATSSDSKPYELNSNQVLVGKVNHTDNCLTDNIHVVNSAYINKESIDDIRKGIVENDHSLIRQAITCKTAQPFSYTSLDEPKELIANDEDINCAQTETPDILLNDLNQKEDETNIVNDNKQVPERNILNIKNGDQLREVIPLIKGNNDLILSHDESLSEFEQQESVCIELVEDNDQVVEQNCRNSNTLNEKHTISDNSMADQIESLHTATYAAKLTSESQSLTNKQLDSCNSNEVNDILHENEEASNEQTKCTRSREEGLSLDNNSLGAICEDTYEGQVFNEGVAKPLKQSPQRSPKHLLPQLQLLNLTYISLTANTVKLKWTYQQPHSLQDQLYAKHYVVEMLPNKLSAENNSQNSRIVYQGHSNNCRISHLSSQQQYSFRVRTTSEEHLVISNILTITTPEQQPISNKFNKKSKQQLLQQQIQQQQHQIHQQQILLQQQQQLQEQHSRLNDSEEPVISGDQRCAIVILLLFTLFALIVAVLIQQLLTD